jgi:hypothetical protein
VVLDARWKGEKSKVLECGRSSGRYDADVEGSLSGEVQVLWKERVQREQVPIEGCRCRRADLSGRCGWSGNFFGTGRPGRRDTRSSHRRSRSLARLNIYGDGDRE